MTKDTFTYQYLDAEMKLRKKAKMNHPSVTGWLLEHGRFFEPAELSASRGLKPMTKKECFSNCSHVAIDRLRSTRSEGHRASLYYCEGYAFGSVIPVMHAWLCTPNGVVQDPTWTGTGGRPTLGTEYFGVAFKTTFLMKMLMDYGVFGLLDSYESEFAIIRGITEKPFHWPLYSPINQQHVKKEKLCLQKQ